VSVFKLLITHFLFGLCLADTGTFSGIEARKCITLAAIETMDGLTGRADGPSRLVPEGVPIHLLPFGRLAVCDLSAGLTTKAKLA